ncbi:RNA-binding protein [candidate division KSB3 bacterium]|uniref:RNA-binding protein n=1 Tax=candidate division KSB3 bacterium TaxID=2044937 RepID=A0A9D5JT11_9BACT|nr:RNA-binding protein [candidate division KSB3 bacterium]MBD3323645.1 RNA-binding protein [candidate division KSB3 bacterium]
MNIYVGNLPYRTTELELQELFAPFGQVDRVSIIHDRETGRSRGFGFVEMDADAARVAIEQLDGTELSGRALRINEARERTRRPRKESRT